MLPSRRALALALALLTLAPLVPAPVAADHMDALPGTTTISLSGERRPLAGEATTYYGYFRYRPAGQLLVPGSFEEIQILVNGVLVGTTYTALDGYFSFQRSFPTGAHTLQVIAAPGSAKQTSSSILTVQTATAPAAPASLSVVAGAIHDEMVLSWSLPTSDGGRAILKYRVYRILAGVREHRGDTVASIRTFTDITGSATTYTWEVVAQNTLGEGAAASASATSQTFPAADSLTGALPASYQVCPYATSCVSVPDGGGTTTSADWFLLKVTPSGALTNLGTGVPNARVRGTLTGEFTNDCHPANPCFEYTRTATFKWWDLTDASGVHTLTISYDQTGVSPGECFDINLTYGATYLALSAADTGYLWVCRPI